jgi:hypothetical protein
MREDYSPSLTEKFRKDILKLALKENFEYFNESNTTFKLGSAEIKVMNWEIFDTTGNLFIPSITKEENDVIYRDILDLENCNSLGVLLIQGNKKSIFLWRYE